MSTDFCRTDARSKSKMKVSLILPCKKEKDKVNANNYDEVKVAIDD